MQFQATWLKIEKKNPRRFVSKIYIPCRLIEKSTMMPAQEITLEILYAYQRWTIPWWLITAFIIFRCSRQIQNKDQFIAEKTSSRPLSAMFWYLKKLMFFGGTT